MTARRIAFPFFEHSFHGNGGAAWAHHGGEIGRPPACGPQLSEQAVQRLPQLFDRIARCRRGRKFR